MRRHQVDAAILFSDIVVPLKLAGIDVEIVPGIGPVVRSPIRTAADVAALPELDPAALAPIDAGGRQLRRQLGRTPLIGFAGAPFTLASYLVEGGPSREHLRTKALMHADPETWHALAGWVAEITGHSCAPRCWPAPPPCSCSTPGPAACRWPTTSVSSRSTRPTVLRPVADLPVPRVHFGVNTGELLAAMRDTGADVMGVDHRIPLDVANERLGGSTPLQGNIDPALLFAGDKALQAATLECLRAGAAAPGHVVNLGHGVPPDTDPGRADPVGGVHPRTAVTGRPDRQPRDRRRRRRYRRPGDGLGAGQGRATAGH